MGNSLRNALFILAACAMLVSCGRSSTQAKFDEEMHRIDDLSAPSSKLDKLQAYLRDHGIAFDEATADKLVTAFPSSAPPLKGGTFKRVVFSPREEASGNVVRAGITYYVDVDAKGSIVGVEKETANIGP